MEKVFIELGFEVFFAAVFGIIAKVLKQPLIIAYILTGFILGPSLFGIAQNNEMISLFSTIGIAFLLFIVGMELSAEKLADLGKRTLVIGFFQIAVTAFLGYITASILGLSTIVSLYIGVVLAFSSTVIVVNLLTEKRAISAIYGKMAIGILVLQDIVALFVLMFLSGLKGGEGMTLILLGGIIVKGIIAFGIVYLISHFLIAKIFKYLAHSPDLLFLASIAWCFAIAGFSVLLGFSIEMGAFLAGISLANIPYAEDITLKLSPLRDFFLILFFITLGMQVDWDGVGGYIIPLIVLVLFVMIIKSLVILIGMGLMGYTRRTSFYTAISLSQVSEFSLIIAAIGLSLGHLDKSIVSLIILVTIITILTSSYLVTFLGNIYNIIQRQLGLFEKNGAFEKKQKAIKLSNHIVMFGYHRLGKQILNALEKISKKIIIVDIDPDVIEGLECQGRVCVYGDAYNVELIDSLNIAKAKMIVTTFGGLKSNKFLIKKAREVNKKVQIITLADHVHEALALYEAGADYVIVPHYISGEHVSYILNSVKTKKKSLEKIKKYHISSLRSFLKV